MKMRLLNQSCGVKYAQAQWGVYEHHTEGSKGACPVQQTCSWFQQAKQLEGSQLDSIALDVAFARLAPDACVCVCVCEFVVAFGCAWVCLSAWVRGRVGV